MALNQATGDYAGVPPLPKRTLAIRENALGVEHSDTATSLNNLAGLLESTGDYAGARPLLERALRISEQVLGADHPDTQIIRGNLNELLGKMRG